METGDVMASKTVKGKKETGKFQGFLIAIVIPFILLLIIALLVLTVSGVDVLDKAKEFGKNIPVISSVVGSEEDEQAAIEEKNMNEESTVTDQAIELQKLKEELQNKQATIDELNQEVVKLNNQLETSKKDNPDDAENDENSVLEDVSSSFKDMTAKKAAPIIANLEQDTALTILSNLPNDQRGEILAQMSPDLAAQLTSAFLNTAEE